MTVTSLSSLLTIYYLCTVVQVGSSEVSAQCVCGYTHVHAVSVPACAYTCIYTGTEAEAIQDLWDWKGREGPCRCDTQHMMRS